MVYAPTMPKYEYACIQCDLDYEKERSIHEDAPNYVCDVCGYALQRVFSSFGLQFKGGGFYSTGN
jgi:putative FmdB family regulatory protein